MFVLLHRLQRLRRDIALPAPGSGGSLALRHVDAGSCNGCEHELTAAAIPFYDLQRFGLNVVASPRHADVLLVTGVVTRRMAGPLLDAFNAMPESRLVAALGDCAMGCGVLADHAELADPLEAILPVDISIPGCPPAPDEIARALQGALDLMRQEPRGGRRSFAAPERALGRPGERQEDEQAPR
jgi:Ni,Fe-hydrogenase III small subunit